MDDPSPSLSFAEQSAELRDKLQLVFDQIEAHSIDTAELPAGEIAALEQANQLLEALQAVFGMGSALPEAEAARLVKEMGKTGFIIAHHVENLRAHIAQSHDVILHSTLTTSSAICPCGSGDTYGTCCENDPARLREAVDAEAEDLAGLQLPTVEPGEHEWQPISKLNMLADMIRHRLDDSKEQRRLLDEATTGSLDDATVKRVAEVYTKRLEWIGIDREQLERWQADKPTEHQLERTKTGLGLLQEEEELTRGLLKWSEQFVTIDKIMEMSDADLGLLTLLGELEPPR